MPAADDLERICAWIEQGNPEAASRVAGTIYGGCAGLKDFPYMGRESRRMTVGASLSFRRCLTLWCIGSGEMRLKSRGSSTQRKIGLEIG
jgi:plasmid stabilization system protein ParE